MEAIKAMVDPEGKKSEIPAQKPLKDVEIKINDGKGDPVVEIRADFDSGKHKDLKEFIRDQGRLEEKTAFQKEIEKQEVGGNSKERMEEFRDPKLDKYHSQKANVHKLDERLTKEDQVSPKETQKEAEIAKDNQLIKNMEKTELSMAM